MRGPSRRRPDRFAVSRPSRARARHLGSTTAVRFLDSYRVELIERGRTPDYDGQGKAWVRFDDGTDAIVGGSRVER